MCDKVADCVSFVGGVLLFFLPRDDMCSILFPYCLTLLLSVVEKVCYKGVLSLHFSFFCITFVKMYIARYVSCGVRVLENSNNKDILSTFNRSVKWEKF